MHMYLYTCILHTRPAVTEAAKTSSVTAEASTWHTASVLARSSSGDIISVSIRVSDTCKPRFSSVAEGLIH